MSKKIKAMLMSEIQDQLGEASNLVMVDVSRLDANANNAWRLALRESNISALTVKNTLARHVLEERGVQGLEGVFAGPTTLVWGSEDVVELSKSITKWAKELEELQVKGATVEGNVLDEAGVTKLSKSPGRAELLSGIAGLMLAPARQVAGALLGPGGRVSGAVKAASEREGAPNRVVGSECRCSGSPLITGFNLCVFETFFRPRVFGLLGEERLRDNGDCRSSRIR